MNLTIKPAPVRKRLHVNTTPERAFAVFTARMHAWWPLDHSLLQGKPRQDVIIEPRSGGRWFERATDGSECTWGRVLAWEPPGRVLLAWQIDATWRFDPDFVTEVEIRFIPEGGATRVRARAPQPRALRRRRRDDARHVRLAQRLEHRAGTLRRRGERAGLNRRMPAQLSSASAAGT